jgi:hypothetical protein
MKDINTALEIFLEAATKQAEATEQGDYKMANKCYNKIIKAIDFLKRENAIDKLLEYLTDTSIGVRLWSACFLLPIYKEKGIRVLKDIVKTKGIHSLTAETTLSEWKKGNLKF